MGQEVKRVQCLKPNQRVTIYMGPILSESKYTLKQCRYLYFTQFCGIVVNLNFALS